MARPVIAPLSILPTAPETFTVLEQRMRIAEEQAESLIIDLHALGVTNHRPASTKLKYQNSAEVLRPISPVRARPVFTGDGDTLWRNCENLVNRTCHMESMLQTLKLSVFRLHTGRELNTKHCDELEQRLREMQEVHAQELKSAQLENMRLRQRLNCAIEDREREEEAKERLSAALEIATTSKTDVAIAAEELKATKARMSQKLVELQEKLSQEAASRAVLEGEQTALLLTVQDMKKVVEEERAQVQQLQQYCHTMHREGQDMKDTLQQVEPRCQKLEKENKQFQTDLEAKDSLVSHLQEEVKIIKQKCVAEQAELAMVRDDSVVLREAAERVQSLNQQLENQCSDLTVNVQKLTNENIQLVTQHQLELKILQDTMGQKLQEQEHLLSAVQASLSGELQNLQSHRTQLERELEILRAEHTECRRKDAHAEKKNTVQKEIQDSTIARLRADLDFALRDRATLINENIQQRKEVANAQSDFQETKQNLEVQLSENKLVLETVQSSLLTQEQENKQLVEHVAVLEQEQHAKKQVELLLTELTDSKNKLAYEKGKMQSTIEHLQSELQSFCDAQSENSKLRKLSAALQTKYTQTNSELDSCKIQLQRTKAKLQQAERILLQKEEDFTLAVKARDEAVKEEERLREQIEAVEEKEDHNKAALKQQLSDVCEERTRMSETLEQVLSSHNQLQQHLVKLQTELGRRDCDILNLQKDRTQSQKQIQKLDAELSECQTKLQAAESQQRGKIKPLQRSIEVAREDNQKLACALEQTLQRNSALQNYVDELEKKLEKKEAQEKKLLLITKQAEEDIQIKTQLSEEQLASVKKQHQLECKDAKKTAQKEMTELKKALDCVSAKSAELSRANRELRKRESILEKETLHQKDLIRGLKTQLRSCVESKGTRKQAERIQALEVELERMEKMKEEYEKSNNEQCKHIEQFMSEVGSLRKEIVAAASQKAKENTLQSQLEKEMKSRQELEESYKELEHKVQKLQDEKTVTDRKLREASVESEQISISLQEAHNWFECHFDEPLKNGQRSSKEDVPEYNHVKRPQFLPHSTVEHWETKQKLKLISRNSLVKERSKPHGDQILDTQS
ncbi:coiled-coil domain-containing protein 150 isoform X2 [Mixophyes fleayi]